MCRERFWFSGLKSIQGRLQVCNSPWVSICQHNREHNAAALLRWRVFCSRQLKRQCVHGIPAKIQVKFVPLVKSHSSQSSPSPRLPKKSLPIPFQKAAAFPVWMPSPCPADVYQNCMGTAWLPSKPAACRKGKSMRVLDLRHLNKSCRSPSTLWAVSGSCDRIPQHLQIHWKKTADAKKYYCVGLIYWRKGITAADV